MPHKENPAAGHNPFDVIGNAKKGSKGGSKAKPNVGTKKKGPTSSGAAKRRPGSRSRVQSAKVKKRRVKKRKK